MKQKPITNEYQYDYLKEGKRRKESSDPMTWLAIALIIAALFAWNQSKDDPPGYDHTVQCVEPATNCG